MSDERLKILQRLSTIDLMPLRTSRTSKSACRVKELFCAHREELEASPFCPIVTSNRVQNRP